MKKKCQHCKSVKPPRSHHCSTCGRCVLKMDHHCPWMNNCIGLRNQKAFLLFNFYTCITALWTTVRVIYAAIECADKPECDTFSTGVTILIVLILLNTGLFSLFTCVMFCDQVRMIQEDTSTIDRMQARRAAKENAGNTNPENKQEAADNLNKRRTRKGCSCRWHSLLCFLPCSFGQDISVEGQLVDNS